MRDVDLRCISDRISISTVMVMVDVVLVLGMVIIIITTIIADNILLKWLFLSALATKTSSVSLSCRKWKKLIFYGVSDSISYTTTNYVNSFQQFIHMKTVVIRWILTIFGEVYRMSYHQIYTFRSISKEPATNFLFLSFFYYSFEGNKNYRF